MTLDRYLFSEVPETNGPDERHPVESDGLPVDNRTHGRK